jgi:hypothetical protein
MTLKSLPRLTDINGVLTLIVWDGTVDHNFPVTIGQVANLTQDCVDAMARRARQMDGKGPVR